ncbi:outer membrane protein [Bradyrhizobium sp. HKCCYLS2058]|uniref:outer membrane protein n=1 Tax=Bradyrhizobium TaxID=374 RepID=UPI0028EE229D|nr:MULTISPECIES: outer membrane beta-barrel protein [unclassified Bradyrhizobium]
MMKTLFGATVGLGAIAAATSAFAADLPMKKGPYTKAPPAVVATVYDWSGFYVGFNAGGGSSRDCWNLVSNAGVAVNPAANREGCSGGGGAAVGGQVGYRYQMANWVFGVEAQGDWANFKGTNRNLILPNVSDRSRTNGFGLFTGQVGYAFDNILGYIKGGAAVVGDRYDTFTTGTNVMLDRANTTRWGGTVGAGIEYGFAPNWSVGVEYDHIFLGNKNLNFVAAAGAPAMTHRIKQDIDIGLVKLNYKFGPGFGMMR